MPWLRAFEPLIRRAGTPAWLNADTSGEEDQADVPAAWPAGLTVDDPIAGRVEGPAEFDTFVADSAAWLDARGAWVRPAAVTAGSSRIVAEFDVQLNHDDRLLVLPVAVAIEPDLERRSLAVRIYHSQWPLLGHHVVRPPLLPADPMARESDVVAAYQAALGAGDTDRILETFEPDGCFREPSGPEYRRCGMDALRPFFAGFFGDGGGIVLEHCTVTDDGVRTALEFNAIRWGRHELPPQAGLAVYERGRSGRIADARIYDDVSPPME